jgi:hypothetical protein
MYWLKLCDVKLNVRSFHLELKFQYDGTWKSHILDMHGKVSSNIL